jgi:threonine/homoserine/homoserine lactone efflux protein
MLDLGIFPMAAVLLTLAPGPDNLQVLIRGMTQGRRAALIATCGFVSGIIVHTALAVCGIALLIRSTPLLFALLQYAGAAYLLTLGVRTLYQPSFLMPADRGDTPDLIAVFRQCFLGNVLNPKVSLFFLSFLPQFVDAQTGAVEGQMLLLGIAFMAQAFILFATIGWFSAGLGVRLKKHPGLGRRLNTAAGVTFIAIGIKLALGETGP